MLTICIFKIKWKLNESLYDILYFLKYNKNLNWNITYLCNECISWRVVRYPYLVCTEEMLTPTDTSVMSVTSPSFPQTDLPNLFTSVGVVSNTPSPTAEILVTFNSVTPPKVTTVTTTVTKATSVTFTLLDENDVPIKSEVNLF